MLNGSITFIQNLLNYYIKAVNLSISKKAQWTYFIFTVTM